MKINSSGLICSITPDHPLDEILWFPLGMKREVKKQILMLVQKDVFSIRVGINCREFKTEKGSLWYNWLMSALNSKFTLELCFDKFMLPPSALASYNRYSLAEIVESFVYKYGEQFDRLELWRDPLEKYLPITSSTNIFSDELLFAASWAIYLDKKVTIGGIQAGDFEWLSILVGSGFLKKVDAIRLDSEGDLWSTNTLFLARAIEGILLYNGLTTSVLYNPLSSNSDYE